MSSTSRQKLREKIARPKVEVAPRIMLVLEVTDESNASNRKVVGGPWPVEQFHLDLKEALSGKKRLRKDNMFYDSHRKQRAAEIAETKRLAKIASERTTEPIKAPPSDITPQWSGPVPKVSGSRRQSVWSGKSGSAARPWDAGRNLGGRSKPWR